MSFWKRFTSFFKRDQMDTLYQQIAKDRNMHKLAFEKLYYQMSPVERAEFDYLNSMETPPKSVLIYKHYYLSQGMTSSMKKIDNLDS